MTVSSFSRFVILPENGRGSVNKRNWQLLLELWRALRAGLYSPRERASLRRFASPPYGDDPARCAYGIIAGYPF